VYVCGGSSTARLQADFAEWVAGQLEYSEPLPAVAVAALLSRAALPFVDGLMRLASALHCSHCRAALGRTRSL
jgi:hypothetical protein